MRILKDSFSGKMGFWKAVLFWFFAVNIAQWIIGINKVSALFRLSHYNKNIFDVFLLIAYPPSRGVLSIIVFVFVSFLSVYVLGKCSNSSMQKVVSVVLSCVLLVMSFLSVSHLFVFYMIFGK